MSTGPVGAISTSLLSGIVRLKKRLCQYISPNVVLISYYVGGGYPKFHQRLQNPQNEDGRCTSVNGRLHFCEQF